MRLGFKSSRSDSSCGVSCVSSVFRSLRARSLSAFPLVYWRVALRALPTSTSKISHSLWGQAQLRWELCVVPLVRVLGLSQIARARLEKCCGGSVWFFWRVPLHTSPDSVFVLLLPVSGWFFFYNSLLPD